VVLIETNTNRRREKSDAGFGVRRFHAPNLIMSKNKNKLECGPMPNLMVALPNIGGALCSMPQSLADAHY